MLSIVEAAALPGPLGIFESVFKSRNKKKNKVNGLGMLGQCQSLMRAIRGDTSKEIVVGMEERTTFFLGREAGHLEGSGREFGQTMMSSGIWRTFRWLIPM